jgi:hypothetical protein
LRGAVVARLASGILTTDIEDRTPVTCGLAQTVSFGDIRFEDRCVSTNTSILGHLRPFQQASPFTGLRGNCARVLRGLVVDFFTGCVGNEFHVGVDVIDRLHDRDDSNSRLKVKLDW